ncbi:hypothetical protein K504DRAFT_506155 [Pleomassaria siparia CBS 279.74]|uniref:CorA-like transporter domain-containing protein n=1 Tax=Pleomassaria siparia CBS 279.74 TaxID=1314801 RepID=A0A6G1JY65_9PLEO|nr:hypothetical protein K504DRAFT_506155 [Pleomassaria siparia CBS 279.74]
MSSHNFQPRPWTVPESKVLLEDGSRTVNLQIVDICEDNTTSTTYTKPKDALEALTAKPIKTTKIRIISVYSRRTIAPLDITSHLLERIFTTYSIHADFADVVSSFGQDPNIAEGSSNNATIYNNDSGDCEVSYQIRYNEKPNRGGRSEWSLRHTGVFHKHDANVDLDVFILLHPVRDPTIRHALVALEGATDTAQTKRREICDNPFRVHTSLFACYFDNWRWYLRYLGKRFAEENDMAMVVKPEQTQPNSSYLRVQRLRNTNDLVIFSRACCSGNLDLLTRLGGSPLMALSNLDEIYAHQSKMKGYIESSDVLKGRIQNSIDLVGYTLTLHNQLEAVKVDKELRDLTRKLKKLTQDTVDDSATVKVITFLSAIYLPGSFIGTLYGMNFFLFDEESNKLRISPDFWIFLATWLPLTLFTGCIYMLILYMDSRVKHKRFRWPWQMKPTEDDDDLLQPLSRVKVC